MAPVDTYWTTQGQTPGNRVLEHATPGSAKTPPAPYLLLRGSPGVDIDAPQIAADAADLYPVFDGDTNLIPSRPANFASPGPQDFMNWHTAHQLAYLAENGTVTTTNDGDGALTVRHATIGTSAAARENLHVVLSHDRTRVIVINMLDKTSIAKLPLDDQRALALRPEFRALIAEPYALEPTPAQVLAGETASTIRADIAQNEIGRFIDSIKASTPYGDKQAEFDADPAVRAQYYHYFFTNQLEVLRGNLDRMAVFDRDAIRRQVGEILERYQRVQRYAEITPAPNPTDSPRRALNATDYNASIQTALQLFLRIEAQIHDLTLAGQEVARTGAYQERRLDTPGMIFVLQSFANYRLESEAEAKTEELNQQNRILQDYTAIQRWVNQTLSKYDPESLGDTDDNEVLPIGGFAGESLAGLTTNASRYSTLNRTVLDMFDTTAANSNNNSFHPIEQERSITRPTIDMFGYAFGSVTQPLPQHRKTVYDTFAINLAEASKLINQESQVRMDEINKLNKQKNRHYDLASNTLNKMTEMLRSIIT